MAKMKRLQVSKIQPSPQRARKGSLEVTSLAESIGGLGLLQPIKVRPLDGGGYECVFGHRRLEAAKQAGKKTVDALVVELTDEQVRREIWAENEERQDLDDVSKGEFCRRWMDEEGLTREQLATIIGYSVPSIDNWIALLKEPRGIQQLVKDGLVTGAHVRKAKEHRRLKEKDGMRLKVLKETARRELSVNEMDLYITGISLKIARKQAEKREKEYKDSPAGRFWARYGEALDFARQPEVKWFTGCVAEWQKAIETGHQMLKVGKFSPEAKRWVANRIGDIQKREDELVAALLAEGGEESSDG